jgi:undecaprenyl-diphosphatase
MTYIFGFLFNTLLNIILKLLIRQPRPSEDKYLFNILKNVNNVKMIDFDKYGMPSGHAQYAFYSTVFIYLALKDIKITAIYLIIALITCFQRVYFKNHTIMQVIVGMMIGSILGYLFYHYSMRLIKGSLKSKKDDNAPL